MESVEQLKALYTSPPGRPVHTEPSRSLLEAFSHTAQLIFVTITWRDNVKEYMKKYKMTEGMAQDRKYWMTKIIHTEMVKKGGKYNNQSLARYSFIQLSEQRQQGENKLSNLGRRIRTRCPSIESRILLPNNKSKTFCFISFMQRGSYNQGSHRNLII